MKISKNDSDRKVHTLSGHNAVGGKMTVTVKFTLLSQLQPQSYLPVRRLRRSKQTNPPLMVQKPFHHKNPISPSLSHSLYKPSNPRNHRRLVQPLHHIQPNLQRPRLPFAHF